MPRAWRARGQTARTAADPGLGATSSIGLFRVAEDVDSAGLSMVSGTPTFFINERRHHGAFDIEALSREIRAARARAEMAS